MAATGNTTLNKGIPVITDAFVVIVKTEWNSAIVDKLEEGCKSVFSTSGTEAITLVVPGAVEIGFAVKTYAKSGNRPADAFITLGTVIRGDTPHFDYVCKTVTDAVTTLNLTLDAPVIFGVLTLENEEQAYERVGGKHGHKGEEAAITALKMIELNRKLTTPPTTPSAP